MSDRDVHDFHQRRREILKRLQFPIIDLEPHTPRRDDIVTPLPTQHPLVFTAPNVLSAALAQHVADHLEACSAILRAATSAVEPTVFHNTGFTISGSIECGVAEWAKALMSNVLAQIISTAFQLPSKFQLDVDDFLVMYLAQNVDDEAASRQRQQSQQFTPLHSDESVFTVTINLDVAPDDDVGLEFVQSDLSRGDGADTRVRYTQGDAIVFLGSVAHRSYGQARHGPRRQLIFYCLPKTRRVREALPSAAAVRLGAGNTAAQSTVTFYQRYQLYLSHKAMPNAAATSSTAARSGTVFTIPHLPTRFVRFASDIAARLLTTPPAEGPASGLRVNQDPPGPPTFVGVEKLVVAVASFLAPRDVLTVACCCQRWNVFVREHAAQRRGEVWERRRANATKSAVDRAKARSARAPSSFAAVARSQKALVLSIGGLGNAIAGYFWETLAASGGISPDGLAPRMMDETLCDNRFFSEVAACQSDAGRWLANAIAVDSDEAAFGGTSEAHDRGGIATLRRWRQLFPTRWLAVVTARVTWRPQRSKPVE
jgi:hypothetical protein